MPSVKGVTPADLLKNASARTNVTATFSEALRASTVSAGNFVLVKKGTTAPVKARVSYSAATIKGGPGGPTDPPATRSSVTRPGASRSGVRRRYSPPCGGVATGFDISGARRA